MRNVILAGVAAALLCTTAHAAEKKSLYFVVNGASDFWKAAEAGVKKAQTELPNYTLQLKYPEQSSAAIQNRLMDDLVAGGAAGIMVSAVDPKTQIDELNKIAGQSVLFTTDSDAPQSKRIAYIGSSNVEAGKQAGELMKKALPGGAKCMGFVGLPGADNAKERVQGIKEAIAGTKITLVDVRADDIDQPRAKRNVEDTLTADPSINCMVGIYSYNTPQIYQAVKEAGKLGQITIIGFDEDQVTPRRRQGRHHRRHRRAAALRVGLPGHEGHGQVSRGRQELHPRQPSDDHPDQDRRQDQRRRVLGRVEAAAGQVLMHQTSPRLRGVRSHRRTSSPLAGEGVRCGNESAGVSRIRLSATFFRRREKVALSSILKPCP